MSIFNNLAKNLLDFLDTNNKQGKPEVVCDYPDTPRLNGSLKGLLPQIGMRSGLIIPATEMSVYDESYITFRERLETKTSPNFKRQAEDNYFLFSNKRQEIIKNGFMYVSAERVLFNLVEISACINDRGSGDEDGFGVECDTLVKGYLSLEGKFISPVALEESNTNINIKHWLVMDINPVDSSGKIKIFPYEGVKKEYNLPGYFEVNKDESIGLVDNKLNLIIPIRYKMLHGDANGLIWVRLHNGLCAILDISNHIVIPPLYSSLSYIDTGKYKGFYKAELNGMSLIIDRSNTILK